LRARVTSMAALRRDASLLGPVGGLRWRSVEICAAVMGVGPEAEEVDEVGGVVDWKSACTA
jgi:hypothetical protein